MEQRQPADDHVGIDVDVRADEHRLGVGHHVAVADPDGLGGVGGPGCQLQQRDVVVTGLYRIDRTALK